MRRQPSEVTSPWTPILATSQWHLQTPALNPSPVSTVTTWTGFCPSLTNRFCLFYIRITEITKSTETQTYKQRHIKIKHYGNCFWHLVSWCHCALTADDSQAVIKMVHLQHSAGSLDTDLDSATPTPGKTSPCMNLRLRDQASSWHQFTFYRVMKMADYLL